YSSLKATALMGPMLGEKVDAPYGAWCLEAMDSHAGWIAGAPELVKLACAFMDPKACKILNEESVESMLARPPNLDEKQSIYYAKGWLVQQLGMGKRIYWHDGSIHGSSTMLVHRMDGITFALLFNSNEEVEKTEPVGVLNGPLHQAVGAIFA